MDHNDVTALYHAFLQLCDCVEEDLGCSKCPMYSSVCFNPDQTAVNAFAESLKRIREECGIKRNL